MRSRLRCHQLGEFASQLLGDGHKRAQRPRREQGVTGSPQHRGDPALLGAEAAHQRRLADAGFAPDQHEVAALVAGDGSKPLRERGKFPGAFEQLASTGGHGAQRPAALRAPMSHGHPFSLPDVPPCNECAEPAGS